MASVHTARTKGTLLVPLVVALKNLPEVREKIPVELRKYLDQHVLASGWYPARDYFTLLEVLVASIDPALVGGDVWAFLGRTAAERDVGGSQESIPEANRVSTQGIYRNFGRGDSELGLFFGRATRLWGQYYDRGTMEVRGGRVKDNSIVIRLTGFHIPLEGFVRAQVTYLTELASLAGIRMSRGQVLRSTAQGEPFCEWALFFERSPESEAYVQSLPRLPE